MQPPTGPPLQQTLPSMSRQTPPSIDNFAIRNLKLIELRGWRIYQDMFDRGYRARKQRQSRRVFPRTQRPRCPSSGTQLQIKAVRCDVAKTSQASRMMGVIKTKPWRRGRVLCFWGMRHFAKLSWVMRFLGSLFCVSRISDALCKVSGLSTARYPF